MDLLNGGKPTAEDVARLRETLQSALACKEAGNAALKAGDIDEALKQYHYVSIAELQLHVGCRSPVQRWRWLAAGLKVLRRAAIVLTSLLG